MSDIELNKKETRMMWVTVRSILELDSFKHKINGKKVEAIGRHSRKS